MVGKVSYVLALGFLGLYAGVWSSKVPIVSSWKKPSFQLSDMRSHVGQNPVSQSGVTEQEGNLPLKSFSETNHSWQKIQKVSEASQLCEVDESSRVRCGEVGIGPAKCKALNCCYDNRQFIQAYNGPMCFYGNAVTVRCTTDGQFVLIISKDITLPSINLDSIKILGATEGPCMPVARNDDFAIYQFPVAACGARKKVEGDYIVYENTMASLYEVGFGPHGAITRDSSFRLTFQCRYLTAAVKDLVVEVKTLPFPPPIVQQGALSVELRIANGLCTIKGCSDADVYRSYYTQTDYPVTKVLQEPVYVEVHLMDRSDPNITLVLSHCWATSSPDPLSRPQWDLLFNGCPYHEDRFLTQLVPVDPSSGLQYPSHYRRFMVKMFAFVDQELVPQKEQLFFHCNTDVCQLSDTESCEPSCHRRRRRSVSATQDSGKKVLVSSGMVRSIADSPDSADSQVEVPQGVGYGLYGVVALTAVSVAVLLMAVLRRQKRHSRLQVTRL